MQEAETKNPSPNTSSDSSLERNQHNIKYATQLFEWYACVRVCMFVACDGILRRCVRLCRNTENRRCARTVCVCLRNPQPKQKSTTNKKERAKVFLFFYLVV